MSTDSWVTIVCTMFVIILVICGWFYSLYRKERDKREDKFKEDLMKKLDAIGLSAREKEIQQRVMEGKASQEIADDLFIEKSTVDTHRKHINVKFKKAKVKKQFFINL